MPNFHSLVYRDPSESYFSGEILPLSIGCGQVIFVKKTIQIIENGGFRSHDESPYLNTGDLVSGRCQWVKLYSEGIGNFTVMNFHGLWQKDSKKLDTQERLEQSERVKVFFDSLEGKKIMCGDFNMLPHIQAMSSLEDGMRNLIKEYKIESTRNSHYQKEERFSDYVLVSKNIEVIDFKVLPEEVSDHCALLLDFK